MSQPDDERSSTLRRFDDLGKATVAVTFGAAVLVSLANTIIFSGWGLSYADVANFEDLFRSTITTLPIIFLHAVISAMLFNLGRRIPREHHTVFGIFAFLGFVFIGALSYFSKNPQVLNTLGFDTFPSPLKKIFWFTSTTTGLLLILTCGFFYGKEKSHSALMINGLLFGYLTTLMFFLTTYAVFAGDRLRIAGSGVRCAEIERVVWIGSARAVTTCGAPPYSDSSVFFILPIDELSFVSLGRGEQEATNAQTH